MASRTTVPKIHDFGVAALVDAYNDLESTAGEALQVKGGSDPRVVAGLLLQLGAVAIQITNTPAQNLDEVAMKVRLATASYQHRNANRQLAVDLLLSTLSDLESLQTEADEFPGPTIPAGGSMEGA